MKWLRRVEFQKRRCYTLILDTDRGSDRLDCFFEFLSLCFLLLIKFESNGLPFKNLCALLLLGSFESLGIFLMTFVSHYCSLFPFTVLTILKIEQFLFNHVVVKYLIFFCFASYFAIFRSRELFKRNKGGAKEGRLMVVVKMLLITVLSNDPW